MTSKLKTIPFKQVDVFTNKPFKGNPLAVIMDASSLSTEEMQQIANWTNLSETTFVVPTENAQADYNVRIFTPNSELPFAGHPTVGTAFALLEAGLISPKNGKIVQECKVGLIDLDIKIDDQGEYSISFELPKPVMTPVDENKIQKLEGILGCLIDRQFTPIIIDVGPRWLVVKTKDAEAVLATKPNFSNLEAHDKEMDITGVCLYGYWSDKHIEVRSFAPSCGVNEDPVCGSGNGSVTSFIRHYSDSKSGTLQSSQGSILGRDGQLKLEFSEDKVLVGGNVVTCIDGIVRV